MPSANDPQGELQHRLSVFHHEAATPVALIGSVLRHLQRSDELTSEHENLVGTASRQVDVLERLLDQVRVANQDEIDLQRESVDLVELVGELIGDLRTTVLAKHPCDVHAPRGPVPAEVDSTRVRQLLTNLLDNAARFSAVGKQIEVEVRADGEHAVVWVTDQGTGIADPDLERVFERYERATDDGQGLGLGLYVVWRIVATHGGDVEAVPSPAGPGTRFVVRLPARA